MRQKHTCQSWISLYGRVSRDPAPLPYGVDHVAWVAARRSTGVISFGLPEWSVTRPDAWRVAPLTPRARQCEGELLVLDRGDGVIRVDALRVGPPVGLTGRRIGRRVLKLAAIEIHHIPAQARVVGQDTPGQGMKALADSQKTAERHDRISHLPVQLVEHQRVDRTELLACPVIDIGADDLVGGDQV